MVLARPCASSSNFLLSWITPRFDEHVSAAPAIFRQLSQPPADFQPDNQRILYLPPTDSPFLSPLPPPTHRHSRFSRLDDPRTTGISDFLGSTDTYNIHMFRAALHAETESVPRTCSAKKSIYWRVYFIFSLFIIMYLFVDNGHSMFAPGDCGGGKQRETTYRYAKRHLYYELFHIFLMKTELGFYMKRRTSMFYLLLRTHAHKIREPESFRS